MQEQFTRQAESALELAKKTAQSCKHGYIGTEHILIGLLKEKERNCRNGFGGIRCGGGAPSGAD